MNTTKQFTKFITVGLLSTVLNYSVYSILLHFGKIPYLLASSIGFLAGVGLGFRLNQSWTFTITTPKTHHIPTYLTLYATSLVIGIFFLKFLVEGLLISPLIANIGMIGLTTMINFAGTKWIVFR